MDKNTFDDRMIAAHFGDAYEEQFGAIVPPVFMNSLHVFPSVEAYYAANKFDEKTYLYGRTANPTVRLLEKKIAALEHGETALCFASGMAAASTAVLAVCEKDCHILCVRNAYGPLRDFLTQYCAKKLGMEITFISGENLREFEENLRPNTKLIILESPSSIVMSLQDIRAVTSLAKAKGVKTYIDNTFCSPLFQKPLDMGVDIVMHTMSKYLGGHSDLIGGVLVSSDRALMEAVSGNMREWLGGILGPMEAWLVLRGIRTLSARLRQHQETAMAVAEYLEGHPLVSKVLYPGLKSHPQYALMKRQQSGNSGLMSFEAAAPPEKVAAAVNNRTLRVFQIGVSWGGFESLITMPFYNLSDAEAAGLGAGRGIVRIHCGLEGAENLIADLDRLFREIGA